MRDVVLSESSYRQGQRDARDWDGAAVSYAQALKHKPKQANLWVQLGNVQRERRAMEEALAAYRRADQIQPDEADTLHQLARTMRAMGDKAGAAQVYGRVLKIAPTLSAAQREAVVLEAELRPPPTEPRLPSHLAAIVLGTVGGHCNASCPHCPTGKAETAWVPRTEMPWALFTRLIDEIVDLGIVVSGRVSFGLFGDGLLDSMVVERAAYIRRRMPDVNLIVNTNAAAFNRVKHGPLRDYISTMAVHCESLVPATYNHLMSPLRLERVLPKIEEILDAFPGKVWVSTPVSRLNKDEMPALRAWFLERGVRKVNVVPISSRCAEDRTVFNAMAFDPQPVRCRASILDDLIVDCDGQILMCCNDFQRLESVGNLKAQSLEDTLTGMRRFKVAQLLENGGHASLTTCSRCFADSPT